jgi:hypothetical protein
MDRRWQGSKEAQKRHVFEKIAYMTTFNCLLKENMYFTIIEDSKEPKYRDDLETLPGIR